MIYVSALDKCDSTFNFDNKKSTVFFKSTVVGSRILNDGLYMLKMDEIFVNYIIRSKCGRKDNISFMLWHRCLWHISGPRIERLVKDNIFLSLDFFYFDTCTNCLKKRWLLKLGIQRRIVVIVCCNWFTHTSVDPLHMLLWVDIGI